MSFLESESTVLKHRQPASVADLIAFEYWPENSRRIARAAVGFELDAETEAARDELAEEAKLGGRTDMATEADAAYDGIVKDHTRIAELTEQLRALPLDPTAIALVDAIARVIAELPDSLDIAA